MSILKVANVHFESTGANRLEYLNSQTQLKTGGGSFTVSVSGTEVMNVNTSSFIVTGVNVTSKLENAYTQANTARDHANASFTKANAALANTTTTFSGDLTIAGKTDFRQRYSIIEAGTANTINCANGNYFTRTITQSETIKFISPPSGNNAYGMILETVNAGAFTLTFANTPKWPNGTSPTLTSGGGIDILVFVTRDGGTTWRGSLVIKDSK